MPAYHRQAVSQLHSRSAQALAVDFLQAFSVARREKHLAEV